MKTISESLPVLIYTSYQQNKMNYRVEEHDTTEIFVVDVAGHSLQYKFFRVSRIFEFLIMYEANLG